MAKQQVLKEIRDYNLNPRRIGECDPDYREDLSAFDESMTKQADAESCDINKIMARYEKTGQLPDMIQRDPIYGDFSDMASFQEALGIVAHAQSQFAALDAKVRAEFQNDPAKMLEFIDQAASDPEKAKKLYEYGLAVKPDESQAEILKAIRENTNPSKKSPAPDSGV